VTATPTERGVAEEVHLKSNQPTPAAHAVYSLMSLPATARHRRAAQVAGLLLLLVTVVVLPFALWQEPNIPAILPIWTTLACGSDLLTAYLLFGQFAGTRAPSQAVLAAAYLFSGLIIIPFALTFPGAFGPGVLLHAGSQTAIWLWPCWHICFPLGLVIYVLVDTRYREVRLSKGAARRLLQALVLGVLLVVSLLAALAIVFVGDLPVLISRGHPTSVVRLDSLGGLVVSTPSLLACALLIFWMRNRSIVQVWLGVAALAFLLDDVINLWVPGRYTLGWYVSRVDTLLASMLVLCVLLYEASQLYARLANNEADLRNLVESAPIGMSISDEHGTIEVVNAAYCAYVGYSREELVGQPITALFPVTRPVPIPALHGIEPLVREVHTKAGTSRTMLESGLMLATDGYQQRRVSFLQDITERRQTEQHLAQLAHYDMLTGLPNRALFRERLQEAVAIADLQQHLLALLFLDLDGFKEVNDTLGHGLGDVVLQVVAERLVRCVRDGDTVARLAGDEFTIVLPNIGSAANAAHVAEKVLAELAHPCQLSSHSASVTTSIGISLYPGDGLEPSVLLKRADTAMYFAKGRGKNGVAFYADTMPGQRIEGKARMTHRLEERIGSGT
jgi:diguanylate cyclase (GGDEF)-like protein/PAS domain S-box-containing protein